MQVGEMLIDYPWKISYASDTSNPVADFYIPALERSTQYDRKSGFFQQHHPQPGSRRAGGLSPQRRPHPANHELPPQQNRLPGHPNRGGYALRDAVAARLDANLTPPENFAQLKRFEILSWLIQADCLDIRIAIPLPPRWSAPRPRQGHRHPLHLSRESLPLHRRRRQPDGHHRLQ